MHSYCIFVTGSTPILARTAGMVTFGSGFGSVVNYGMYIYVIINILEKKHKK